jgi:sugar phosphate permease
MTTTTTQPKQSRLVSRSPIFYGWIVWGIATVGLIATSPGQSYTVSLFIDHFIADFNLDRTTVSSLYGLGTFLAALSLTWVGRQIDRYGNRRMGVVVSGLFALALVWMSLVTGPLMLFIGFIAIRGLGQGSLSLTNSTVIAQWFKRRRGFVMSLAVVLWALSQRVYVPVVQQLIVTHGWRPVWQMLAAGVALTILPLTWLLIRNRPEDYGLLPDNESTTAAADDSAAEEHNYALRAAIRTPIFWVFILGRILSPAWGTGLILHQVSIFGALGHTPAVAAETYGTFAIMTAVASLLAGMVVDRLRPQWLLALQVAALGITLLIAMHMTTPTLLTLYAIMFGLAMGTGSVFDGAVWTNLYGRQHQGAIRGFVSTSIVIGTAIGPIIFGASFDWLGSYSPVLWLGIAIAVLPLVLSFFVQAPTPAADSESAPG